MKKLVACASVIAVSAMLVLSSAAQAQSKTITLCWAAWDPANALRRLSSDGRYGFRYTPHVLVITGGERLLCRAQRRVIDTNSRAELDVDGRFGRVIDTPRSPDSLPMPGDETLRAWSDRDV